MTEKKYLDKSQYADDFPPMEVVNVGMRGLSVCLTIFCPLAVYAWEKLPTVVNGRAIDWLRVEPDMNGEGKKVIVYGISKNTF